MAHGADLPAPMLARLATELPVGPGWSYEPKWDGFRCLAWVDAGSVVLQSRNDRPLQRYFPEVTSAVATLGRSCLLDGELVVRAASGADFPALMERLHPAASRVQRLARETPATYLLFDLLVDGERDLAPLPLAHRRAALADVLRGADGTALTATAWTTEAARATAWLDAPPGSGIDGVVAKREDEPYQPGRRAMVKVKRRHSIDCVVAGLRLTQDGAVSSLLLGLWDGRELAQVGVVTSLVAAERHRLATQLRGYVVPLEDHPWCAGFGLEGGVLGRLKGTAGRWTPDMPRDWVPLAPVLVAEVGYDHLEGRRFRHPARLLRWRPDRDARSCTTEQLSGGSPV